MCRSRATTPGLVAGVLAGLCCFAPAASACASGAECRPDDQLGVVGTLPQSADAVIVFEAGAAQRAGPAGRAASAFLAESGLFKETAAAWCSLARSLELSPEEAFDVTLGNRAIVVVDGLFDAGGESTRWALLSHVCPRTEARIRAALRPAPRSIELGRPILALENGAYELATAPSCRYASADSGSMILLAPARDAELFDTLLPALAGRPSGPTLSQCDSWQHALKIGGGDVLVYLRRAHESARPDEFLVCAARCTPTGWTAQFTASRALMWHAGPGAELPSVRVPAALDDLARGATALYCGPLAGGGAESRGPMSLGFPTPPRLPQELAAHLGPTIIATLHDGSDQAGPEGPGASGGLSLCLAVETQNLEQTVTMGDRMLSRLVAKRAAEAGPAIALVSSGTPAPAKPAKATETVDFRRLCPADPRVIELTDDDPLQPADRGRSFLSWSYRSGPDENSGWWLINFLQGSTGDEGRESALDALTHLGDAAGTPAPDRAVLSRACIRPDRIATTLGPGAPAPCGSFVRSLRWIESVQWDISRADHGLISGTASVRMKRCAPEAP